jgi:hypothetical protein
MDENMERKNTGGFFERLGWIFYAPSRVFEDIETGAVTWWQPWIWVGLLNMMAAYIFLPIHRLMMEMNFQELPEETLYKMLDYWSIIAAFEVISAPIAVMLVALVTGAIGYILISILTTHSSFKKFFTLYLYASIVGSIGGLLSVLVVRFTKGLETIRAPEDAAFSIGLSFLAPLENKLLEALCKSIDLFAIWALVIIALGLMHVFKLTRNQAILCVIPFWLISIVMLMFKWLTGA